MPRTELYGVVLAAGKGTRINNLQTASPKPVLPIANKSLIYHQLRIFRELGIRDVFIVIGHMGYKIVDKIEKENDLELNINYIEQQETLGIAHSVGCLEHLLDKPFLLFLGDIYLYKHNICTMVDLFSKTGADAVLGTIKEPDVSKIEKNYCISLKEDDIVARVIEKPHFPPTDLKGVGLYLFHPKVFDAIRRTPRTAMRDEYEITDSIQIMIDSGFTVRYSICAERDVNITFPKDLLKANLEFLATMKEKSLVHPDVALPENVEVYNSIIGAGAIVGKGAKLRNSLVLPRGIVPNDLTIEYSIVSENTILKIGE